MAPTFAEVAKSEYVLLTTFTKDGRPKPTAIWVAPDDRGRVVAITQEKSWKVKRIRNTPRVTIAECDRGGKPKGESVEAVAAILDKTETPKVYDAIGRRYGIVGKLFNVFSKLKGGMKNNVGIELKAS
ncbi:PPOX class F420-dependent oxidoreductase [Mycobacterium yunnanensis]|uniref:PPOX class F420-dependent oxidoreductase n=1 Tax=Mycobacterium yunnanensis TaxID=368477 RepID=A0A9X2YQ46_9MYCO|nr:PPOX class F420-dependent oxidoreductase [Mycobacterium yunnanensis]MCV7423567.1 PPOX class F420-dependent oxidoreductase [Mycobacterium yunnanensis]